MKSKNFWGRAAAVAAILLLAGGGAAMAQLQTGNLYGKVLDQTGAALPGVTVTLDTGEAKQVQVTNAQGEFRFLGLAPSTYKLRAELEGFSSVEYPGIVINVGRNTQIEVTLNQAVEETITVTSESPLLDQRRISTGATVSQTELQKIPQNRDPWSVLQTTPGVLTDRINVGGNQAGQQSNYTGPGGYGDQSIWAVDGVVITDMGALGSSPAYYDFDSFQEMQVTTGGSDATIQTGGVVLNMVTKRGTNEWRGSGRYFYDSDSTQSNTSFSPSQLGTTVGNFRGGNPATQVPQPTVTQGNRIVKVQDYGAELGGPIVKDRLWIWGAYGYQEVSLLTINNTSDLTKLPDINGKLNAQITQSNSATLFGLNSDKKKNGRNAGPTRPQETTWNQSSVGSKPSAAKLEDTQIFSPAFYLTGMYSRVNGGFQLVPQGGNVTPFTDASAVTHNSFLTYRTPRPQWQAKADASTFFNTGTLSHELKYGAGYHEAKVTSTSVWLGVGWEQAPGFAGTNPANGNYLALARPANLIVKNKYTQGYAQDTLTVGNLTANVGLRYDKQTGTNLPSTSPANPLRPDILPAVNYGGAPAGFTWNNVVPRLGLTYALGKDRKTLLRASYSRFADQLGAAYTRFLNPLYFESYAYVYTNNPGNGNVLASQITSPVQSYSGNVNPVHPEQLLQSNSIHSGFKAPTTDELLFSAEHSLLPEFVVGLNLTWRQHKNLVFQDLNVFDSDPYSAANLNSVGRPATRNDYVPVTVSVRSCGGVPCPLTLPNGQPYTVTYYVIKPGLFTRTGTQLYNSNAQDQYKGASLVFNKRLANHWMMRGNFTVSDWKYNKIPANTFADPTIRLPGSVFGGYSQGDVVAQGSGTGSGSFGGVYINSKWAYSLNGLYQVMPERAWGFNVGAALNGRQGYPIPYYQRFFLANEAPLFDRVLVPSRTDSFRNPNVHILDGRIEKEFTFSDFGLTLGVDCFNVLNEAYVLQRQHRLQLASNAALTNGSNFVTEITSPRIFRFGAKFSFK
jgi:hypothetical protein